MAHLTFTEAILFCIILAALLGGESIVNWIAGS